MSNARNQETAGDIPLAGELLFEETAVISYYDTYDEQQQEIATDEGMPEPVVEPSVSMIVDFTMEAAE